MTGTNRRVVVCGAGLAGLTAALTALEAGAPVTLFEKAPEPGGTTAISGGFVWTIADFEDLRATVPDGDGYLQWLIHDSAEAGRRWLSEKGVKLAPPEALLGYGWGQLMDPAAAVGVLAERFRAAGGMLACDAGMESLIVHNDRVRGVRILRDGRIVEEMSEAVVLATGGFQGNHELLARYVVRDPDNLYLRANPWSTGDGFLAATVIGAAASPGLDTFYGHALTAPPARFSRPELRDVSQYYGQQSVAINMSGRRFADESEGKGEEILNQRLAQQPGGRGFYIIDTSVLEDTPIKGLEVVTRTIVDRARGAGGPMVTADTLEELCRGLAEHGVPETMALAELKHFNRMMEEGRGDELLPGRSGHRRPLDKPPYIAVGVKAGITFTMGGLRIDDRARVLRRAGTTSPFAIPPQDMAFMENLGDVLSVGQEFRQTAIRGLFAAGCDIGNASHFGYMGGLTTALTTGRVAGREAAARVRSA